MASVHNIVLTLAVVCKCFLLNFTDLYTSDCSVYGDVGGSGVAPEVNDVVWTEELLNTWNENSFTEKVDETADTGPINAGLNTILKELRDFDGDGLRPNQEHERQVSSTYHSNEIDVLITLVRHILNL